MYTCLYPAVSIVPPCYYCAMCNRQSMPYAEGLGYGRNEAGGPMMPLSQQMPGMGQPLPGMSQQMPSVGQSMADMTGMAKVDMAKISSEAQDIVRMLEQHHPDLFRALMACGMSTEQARQYLSRVVEMSLMHHMMHQM